MRVDSIPRLLLPFYWVASAVVGTLFYLYYLLCRFTCRIEIVGKKTLETPGPQILCMWHSDAWPFFAVFPHHKKPQAWINHPGWYMKPAHIMMRLMGVKRLVLGSSGEEGKRAIDELAKLVKAGSSTVILTDGPSGPAKSLKKGVLHLAEKSGAPLVALNVTCTHSISLPTWDSKRFPLPFSSIRVVVQAPIYFKEHGFDETAELLYRRLGHTIIKFPAKRRTA